MAGQGAAGRGPAGRARAWALLALVALVARWPVLGDPVAGVDEQFYLALARRWAGGALPYAAVWDRKPAGLFLLYLPAAALPDYRWGVIAYQLGALLAAVAGAGLVAALARAVGAGRGAPAAALLYLAWLDLAGGAGGQAPVLFNPLMAGAALLIVRGARDGGGRRAGLAAMALAGLAAQVKYSVVFEGAWFGAWLLARDRGPWPGRAGYAAALVLAAAAPTLLMAAGFAAAGAGGEWWYANAVSVLRRGALPWGEALGNAATCAAILLVPVGLAAAGLRALPAGDGRRFLAGWLAAALAGLALFGTWFSHYTLPVLVPALAAGAAAPVLGAGRRRWALGAAALLAGQALLLGHRARVGTPAQFAALAAAVGRGPGLLWVHSGPALLYAATDRLAATRFLFPSHLTRPREAGAIGVDPAAEVARILARRPAVVVMARPFRGEAAAIRAQALAGLAAGGWRVAAVLPLGRDRVAVYRRR